MRPFLATGILPLLAPDLRAMLSPATSSSLVDATDEASLALLIVSDGIGAVWKDLAELVLGK